MLKKVYNFIRSMKFGMALLMAIAVLCVAATAFGYEEIYSTPYFIALFCLLAINLFFCSVVRIRKLSAWKKSLSDRAARGEAVVQTDDPEKWLLRHQFRKKGSGYGKNYLGFTGSFFTHLSMLLLTLAAGCLFAFAETQDIEIYPGEATMLPDGTEIIVEDFTLTDDSGSVEYKSSIRGILPDGEEITGEIQVNHPMIVGQYKVYQQSYAYAVPVGVQTSLEEAQEFTVLDGEAFLGLDDDNGIAYHRIFGNVVEENGEVLVSDDDEIINPAYEVAIIEDGAVASSGLVYPGTTLEADGVYYTFYDPEPYPGLRFKTQPAWAMVLLYLSFALLIFGLYLSFFLVPEAASVRRNGVAIVGQKDISQRIRLYKLSGSSPANPPSD